MRIRTIKPEFWSHPILSIMDDSVRLLAIGLLNIADDEGYFLADPRLIRSALWPFDDQSSNVRRRLDDLSRIGYIELSEHVTHGPIGLVSNFSKHQKVDRPNPSKLKQYFNSTNVRRSIVDQSSTDQGTGNREGNREQGSKEPPLPPVGESARRERLRSLPESLDRTDFRESWEKWCIYWADLKKRTIPNATADSHLGTCIKLGPNLAIEAINNAISRGFSEPCAVFSKSDSSTKAFKGKRASWA